MFVKEFAMTKNNSKKCIDCNLEYSSKYRFCTKCGQELMIINICPGCDSKLGEKSKFCSNCGYNLNNLDTQIVNSYQEEKNNFQLFPSTEPVYSRNIKIGVSIFLGIILLLFLVAGEGTSYNIPSYPGVTIQDLQQLQQQQQNFERQQQFFRDAKQFNDCTQAMTQLGLNTFLC
jgi:hypothetical protein